MEPDDNGRYVLYSDVTNLIKERDELRKRVEESDKNIYAMFDKFVQCHPSEAKQYEETKKKYPTSNDMLKALINQL